MPLVQDLSDSQSFNPNTGNSLWSSSFIHASNGHDYMILSHVGMPGAYFRGSIVDTTDPAYYRQFELLVEEFTAASQQKNGLFNITFDQFEFRLVDQSNPLRAMRRRMVCSVCDN
jgi:hypothetical protein